MLQFLKNWTLPVAMVVGALTYFILANVPLFTPVKPYILVLVEELQPILIFTLLFVSFCKIDPRQMRFCKWHLWALLIQASLFLACVGFCALFPESLWRVVVEGAMLCFIAPTAIAAVVVTSKLGARPESLAAYIVLANLLTAILVPAAVPLIYPEHGGTFFTSFLLIMSRVFPLLLCPFICAVVARKFLRKWVDLMNAQKDLSFYLWAVALALAIGISTRSLVNSTVPLFFQIAIATVSLLCCVLQFTIGRMMGRRFNDEICCGQGMGQKNTIFAIWLGYTFLTPVSSIAGGFYSVWHNIYNSWQLYKKCKQKV